MKKRIMVGCALAILTLSGCQTEQKTENKTESHQGSDIKNIDDSQLSQGVLTKENIKNFVDQNMYGDELVSISYDGNYFSFLSKKANSEDEYIELRAVKTDLTLESKTNIVGTEKQLSSIVFDNFVGVDLVKNSIARTCEEMFNSWELVNDGEQTIYILDTGKIVNAETAEIIS